MSPIIVLLCLQVHQNEGFALSRVSENADDSEDDNDYNMSIGGHSCLEPFKEELFDFSGKLLRRRTAEGG